MGARETTGFIVCEIIPSLPLPAPTVGQRITVYGISREDKEHQVKLKLARWLGNHLPFAWAPCWLNNRLAAWMWRVPGFDVAP